MRFQAALFDMDGVLVDSGRAHLISWQALARAKGEVDFTAELFQHTFGKHGYVILKDWLKREMPRSEMDAWLAEKEAAYRVAATATVKPVLGVVDFIYMLHGAGMKIGVASSGPRENVELVIDLLGIRGLLTGFTHGNEVRHAKPAPDVFLKAAEKAGVSASQCVVFEDSLSGVAAGIAAQMSVVSVATTRTAEELLRAGASLVWPDFRDASVSDLEQI